VRRPPHTLAQLQLESVWRASTVLSHGLCVLSRPFLAGTDRASCAARSSSSHGRFVGDEHPTGVCLPIPLPSRPAARNQTLKSLRYGICIRI
jgi:hypothetical protein